MKTQIAIFAGALLALAACGGGDKDNGDAGTAFAFSDGIYKVSSAAATGTDQCGLLSAYQDPNKTITITSNGAVLLFNLSNDPNPPAGSIPQSTLTGDQITNTTPANYVVAYTNPNCTVRINRQVDGTVTGDDKANLKLDFTVAWEQQGTCTAADTSFNQVPCASTYTFTATHQ